MQATLHFRFPNRQNPKEPRDVSVRVLLQAAEQRPKATLNFFFMCTGQLPSTDVLNSFGIAAGELSATSVGGGLRSSGLKPFAESAVVRIEKNVMMEIGSSMTKTIFGGFIEDEPQKGKQSHPSSSSSSSISTAAHSTHAAGMQQLRAGTLLIGNVGSPNTNGSRYYILLQDVVTEKQRQELSVYQPLGMVVAGLQALCEACGSAAVQPRTLAPLQAVPIWVSEVRLQHRAPTPSSCINIQSGEVAMATQGKGKGRERVVVARMAGHTRRRDEVEAEEEADAGGSGPAARAAQGGFFNLSLTFPKRSDEEKQGVNGSQAKRMRTERYVTTADGAKALRTTAVERGEGEPFDYFAAQEIAFVNDVNIIAETQAARQQRRRGKQQQQKRRTVRKFGLGGSMKTSKSNQGTDRTAVSKKKTLLRRY
ncbi:putative cyclophilin 15 [Trypanosoma cruzi]|uniref:PPIase cyclophilin-type domain-containing protein n=2 Tax=Trypanosoma cruzi TaxID=5693 RepID=Q4CT75_TRYCC|nr:hypothetical protein, conserved [Trypanosoma cruzi]EAN83477.1 hypothetical protein, conserved [Trypanosoma cruzi]PWV10919.1 putative cyclophilin 15 [Trypanosoma cruzi]|eukprot:XP_805328.1 hypothetical protein [Trypanosoma cruzi strain CL Brener]